MTSQPSRLFSINAYLFSVVTLLVAHRSADAQGVSTPLVTNHNVVAGPAVFIGNASNPIPVDLDPIGPPWNKSIGDPNQHVVGISTLDIFETLVNVGTEAWTDWHEFMLAPPVGLVPPIWTNVVSLSVNGNPITYNHTGLGTGSLDLYNFSQSVLPGQVFEIHKQAQVDGSMFANAAFLRLQEYPTSVPEPTCLALFATGAVMYVRVRRRR